MTNWFIVQSHSSFENKVAMQIREEADKNKVSDKIEEIIPICRSAERKGQGPNPSPFAIIEPFT